MNRWMNEQTDGQMDGWLYEWWMVVEWRDKKRSAEMDPFSATFSSRIRIHLVWEPVQQECLIQSVEIGI